MADLGLPGPRQTPRRGDRDGAQATEDISGAAGGGGLFLDRTVTLVLFLEQSLHCISEIRKRGSRRESLLSGHLGQDQVR